jgi:hypothetical protein
MTEATREARQRSADTLVAHLMRSSVAVRLLSLLPIPLVLVRSLLRRDNARENRKDSWQRLRGVDEVARYQAVRNMIERYAGDGFVPDVVLAAVDTSDCSAPGVCGILHGQIGTPGLDCGGLSAIVDSAG